MKFSSPTSISGSLYHFNYYKTPIQISQTGAQPLCGVPAVRIFLDATVSPGWFFLDKPIEATSNKPQEKTQKHCFFKPAKR